MDGWDQLAFSAMSINDVGLQPLYNNNPGRVSRLFGCPVPKLPKAECPHSVAGYFLYFFFAVLWNYFFILQLYIGIFVDNLRRCFPFLSQPDPFPSSSP